MAVTETATTNITIISNEISNIALFTDSMMNASFFYS